MAFNLYGPSPSNILFIDENYLKQTTELGNNVDSHLIINSIRYSQDKFILPVLGSDYFEYLKQGITGGTLNSNDTKVLNQYIQPCLASVCMYEMLPKLLYQFKNKGITTSHSEFSESVKREDLIWIANKYFETSKFYAQRLTQFLVANPTVYTLYNSPGQGGGTEADLLVPMSTQYDTGMYLGAANKMINGLGTGWGLSIGQYIALNNGGL